MKNRDFLLFLAILALVLSALFFLKFPALNLDWSRVVLTVSTFVFSLLIGFTLAGRNKRLEVVRSHLRRMDAVFFNINAISGKLGTRAQEKFMGAVDNYLVALIDFKLINIDRATPMLRIFLQKS